MATAVAAVNTYLEGVGACSPASAPQVERATKAARRIVASEQQATINVRPVASLTRVALPLASVLVDIWDAVSEQSEEEFGQTLSDVLEAALRMTSWKRKCACIVDSPERWGEVAAAVITALDGHVASAVDDLEAAAEEAASDIIPVRWFDLLWWQLCALGPILAAAWMLAPSGRSSVITAFCAVLMFGGLASLAVLKLKGWYAQTFGSALSPGAPPVSPAEVDAAAATRRELEELRRRCAESGSRLSAAPPPSGVPAVADASHQAMPAGQPPSAPLNAFENFVSRTRVGGPIS